MVGICRPRHADRLAHRSRHSGPAQAAAGSRFHARFAAAVGRSRRRADAVRGARRGGFCGPVRPLAHRQRRHGQAAPGHVCPPAQCRARAVLAPVGQQPVQHRGVRSTERSHHAGAGPARPLARHLHADRACRLPALSELAADHGDRGAGAGHVLGHAQALAPALRSDQAGPAGHRRTGLCGRRKRAGASHGAPAWRAGTAKRALRLSEPPPAPAGAQVHRGRLGHDAADAIRRRRSALRRAHDCTLAGPGRQRCRARRHRGRFRRLCGRHDDAGGPDPAPRRRRQPDHARRGGTGARSGHGRDGATRTAGTGQHRRTGAGAWRDSL